MAKQKKPPAHHPIAEYCSKPGVLRAFHLIQEKWVIFIVTALLHEPLGFNKLSRAATGVNPATLKHRMDILEAEGIITKSVISTMPPRTEYRLIAAGEALRPVVEALVHWGMQNDLAARPAKRLAKAASSR